MQLTLFDIGVIGAVILFALRGGMRGMIAELAGFLGIVLGYLLARSFTGDVTSLVTGFISPEAAPFVAGFALFLGGMFLVGILARLLQGALRFSFSGGIDAVLGVIIGGAKGALFCIIPAYLALMLVPHIPAVRDSQVIPYLMNTLQVALSYTSINIPMP